MMREARLANCSVEWVSSRKAGSSCTVAMSTVRPLPPRLSCGHKRGAGGREGGWMA